MRRWLRAIALTSLVLALGLGSVSPVQAVSHTGAWRGPTAQGYTIGFRVNAMQRITSVRFKIHVEGAFCEGVITWEATQLSVPIRADGTFRVEGRDGLDTFLVRGTFTSRYRAKGIARSSIIGGCIASGYTTWVANKIIL